MKKSILYRLFKVGSIPRELRSILEKENIIVFDEGISGLLTLKNCRGPGIRNLNRKEWFLGCLAVTDKRFLCYTFRKRQINISIADPKLSEIHVEIINNQTLSISFESSVFRNGWEGVIEFKFKTEMAHLFFDALISFGAQPRHCT